MITEYGGGHLFKDLVERKPVMVEVETDKGRYFETEVGLDQMPYRKAVRVTPRIQELFGICKSHR